jgi:hypothetical protein
MTFPLDGQGMSVVGEELLDWYNGYYDPDGAAQVKNLVENVMLLRREWEHEDFVPRRWIVMPLNPRRMVLVATSAGIAILFGEVLTGQGPSATIHRGIRSNPHQRSPLPAPVQQRRRVPNRTLIRARPRKMARRQSSAPSRLDPARPRPVPHPARAQACMLRTCCWARRRRFCVSRKNGRAQWPYGGFWSSLRLELKPIPVAFLAAGESGDLGTNACAPFCVGEHE